MAPHHMGGVSRGRQSGHTPKIWTDMQQFLAALRASTPAQLPRLGLRLANGLVEPRPPPQFWQHYVRTALDPNVFERLSPHSKCLLTCVACKLDRDEAKSAMAYSMVERVFREVATPKALALLNIELINMILVASHTLRIQLGRQEMQRILERTQGLMERECHFNIELSVSLLHSLGALARVYPKQREQIASSELIRNAVERFPQLIAKLNLRELSLVLYTFDKLRVVDRNIAEATLARISAERDKIQGQTLATILFACAAHPVLHPALEILMQNVRREASDATGRMACNISSAYIKAGMWRDPLPMLLERALPKMNAQEICNVANLMIHKKVNVPNSFKQAYADHINNNIKKLKLSLLDALTVTQSLVCWGLQEQLDQRGVDQALKKAIETDFSTFGAKHAYVLHYCVLLGCQEAAGAIAVLAQRELKQETLSNKEMVVLLNGLSNLDINKPAIEKVEHVLKQRLEEGQHFSVVDLQTMAHWRNPDICELIAEIHIKDSSKITQRSIRLLCDVLKVTKNKKAKAAAMEAIECILKQESYEISNVETRGELDTYTGHVAAIKGDIATIVASCELLPYLQGELDMLHTFDKTVSKLAEDVILPTLDVKSLITLLSVARKLHVRTPAIINIAKAATTRIDAKADPTGFLEYVNALYHLDIPVEDSKMLLHNTKEAIAATQDDRIKESIMLTLASMAFVGNIDAPTTNSFVMQQLNKVNKATFMGLKSIYMTLTTGGLPAVDQSPGNLVDLVKPYIAPGKLDLTMKPRAQKNLSEHIDTKVHSSVYSTLRKMNDGEYVDTILRAEVPVAFDYVADILLVRSASSGNGRSPDNYRRKR
ncbi:DNA replication licensing MCM5 component, putative [Babesia ovis]|uniref:DNA replication licensing MCM5 component, putative n=1 Tax=Babesia ovis TaxID=5869 RepID=A0A9W5T8C3_BABOV|nr:DNA replication licensing MCM5 component, putative [Babesia ovis]